MPIYTLQRLMSGQEDVAADYVRARRMWDEVLATVDREQAAPQLDDALKTIFEGWQHRFEELYDNRWYGQEVMVYSFFGRLYDDGFGDNAHMAVAGYRAFRASMCSSEIHAIAVEAARSYLLDHDPESR